MSHNFNSLNSTKVAALINGGAVGVMPTDTVYGLVASALNQAAVARLYSLKERYYKLGTIIAADAEQLARLGLFRQDLEIAAQYWPGPVSVVVKAPESLNYLDLNRGDLAVRIPNVESLQELLRKTGPLLTSSANLKDQPVSVNVEEAKAYFGDSVDFYVDGGDISAQAPSTIIRIVEDKIEVLRNGAVKIN